MSSHPGFGLRVVRFNNSEKTRASWHSPTLRAPRGKRPKISGGDIEEATPDPIPNSEVKLFGADGTAREAVWRVGRCRDYFERARPLWGFWLFPFCGSRSELPGGVVGWPAAAGA